MSIVTGEAVALDLRPARIASRLLAALIDFAAQYGVLLALVGIAGASDFTLDDATAATVGIVVLVLVLIVYPVALETLWRGRTLGKAAMGLRVVRDDGGPIGFRQAFVRALTGAFIERPGITAFTGAVISQLLSHRSKRIGDLLAGTFVLQERVPVQAGVVAVMPAPLTGWAPTLDLSRLSDGLALSARAFLARAHALTPQAREDIGRRLVAAVGAVVSPEPPPDTPGWAYLSAVLAERRRREQERLAVQGAIGRPG